MATHDSIGDFLTIIRNASKAGKESCKAQYSKLREGIASILKDEGYITSYEVTGEKAEKSINIVLKYVGGVPALTNISRVSTPGCRTYFQYREIPRVLNGMGISISDEEAEAILKACKDYLAIVEGEGFDGQGQLAWDRTIGALYDYEEN